MRRLALATWLAILPLSLSAQTTQTRGSLASGELITLTQTGSGTLFDIFIRNSGSGVLGPIVIPNLLFAPGAIGFIFRGEEEVARATLVGGATFVGVGSPSVGGIWARRFNPDDVSGDIEQENFPGDGSYWVAGCDAPAPTQIDPVTGPRYGHNAGYFQTCGSSQFIEYQFSFSGATSFAELGPVTAAPEPTSLALLATGLTGLVGIAARRRKGMRA